ncbi:MAG: GGDEF domain-containing protein [Planctomycetota bacterium]|jgi:GGDEF domain-containing protein
MRIEYDRAQRYSYPMVLMLVEVDRLEYLHDLYGYESKEEILHAVLGQLKGLTRESDFLGCMQNERILTAFPHTPEKAAGHIAGRLLQGSRNLQFDSGGRGIRITLSVGIAVSDPDRVLSFEEFHGEAHESLMFAIRAGGDRYVRREPATHLIESLRSELEEEAEALREEQEHEAANEFTIVPQAFPGEPMGSLSTPELATLQDEVAMAQVQALFSKLESRPQEVMFLERELIELVKGLLARARAEASTDAAHGHRGQVDVLERRIEKLKDVLDQTEANLRSVAAAKELDPGVASVYRSVQGLPTGEEGFGRKKEMLTILFEANQDLRRNIRKQSRGKPPTGEE